MHRLEEHKQVWTEHGAQLPLRQILCVPQLVGGPHDGEQVHVVPSDKHTLVRPDAHVSCSAELQAHATASTTQAARARAHLITAR
jgi:hypothetical protein